MKAILFLIIALNGYSCCQALERKAAEPINQKEKSEDDDIDAQVVIANVASMLQSIATISTDPNNPKIVGPNIAQIGIGFLNILGQMFKSGPIRANDLHEEIGQYFDALSDEVKEKLIALVITYADEKNRSQV